MSSLISVKNLSRYYGDHCAVDNISFELSTGDILGFLGPNGAGKSTTMQMLSGNLAPSEGEISINGVDLLGDAKQAKRELGYLPEIPPLYKEMKVDEYLKYVAVLHRIDQNEADDALSTTKERCGLSDSGDRMIGNLSKGYQQRVGIAQALIHSPKVIILDEPTVGLDPNQIREIRALIAELGSTHGIILCSHILPEIQAVCNRVQIINQGKLVYSSDIGHLMDQAHTGSISVTFSRPPEASSLDSLECVDSILSIDGSQFTIRCNDIDTLVKSAVENDWGLSRLLPEERTLEQIFVNLTSGDITDPEGDSGDEQAA